MFSPIPGDKGAHGKFDDRAKRLNPEVWLRTHPGLSVAGLLAMLSGLGLGLRTLHT